MLYISSTIKWLLYRSEHDLENKHFGTNRKALKLHQSGTSIRTIMQVCVSDLNSSLISRSPNPNCACSHLESRKNISLWPLCSKPMIAVNDNYITLREMTRQHNTIPTQSLNSLIWNRPTDYFSEH